MISIIDELMDCGYIANESDILDMDEVYAVFTITLPEGTQTLEIFLNREKKLLRLSSRLGIARDVANRKNIEMGYIAASKATAQLRDYDKIGKITMEQTMNTMEFLHTEAFPIERTEHIVGLIINFAHGSILTKPRITSICAKALTSSLSMDDVLGDHPDLMVQLHPCLKMTMLTPRQQDSLYAFLRRENLRWDQIEALFSGPSLDIYPVIIRRKRILIRLSSGHYCRNIAEFEVENDTVALKEIVEKAFDLYMALISYLGHKPSCYDPFHNAGELLAEIEAALAN